MSFMSLYFVMTSASPDLRSLTLPAELLENVVSDCVRAHCPDLTWLAGFTLPGRAGYLDIVDAPYSDAALRLAVILRERGYARVELRPAAQSLRAPAVQQAMAANA